MIVCGVTIEGAFPLWVVPIGPKSIVSYTLGHRPSSGKKDGEEYAAASGLKLDSLRG